MVNEQKKLGKKTWLWVITIFAIIIVGALATYYFVWQKSNKQANTTKNISTGEKITFPQKVLDNRFGWLGGGLDDSGDGIVERAGAWVRPHPGAFVWDMMQKSKDGAIDFTLADQEVKNYQKNNLGILATIWPFADWDQINLANAADCKVLNNDEFLPKNDKKGRGVYLPQYRCNPNDWEAYQTFVKAIVARYDGDGVSDMPGLEMPIKYWEVMNEPDLQYNNSNMQINQTNSLNFYKQGPAEYADLLIKTNRAIKEIDADAKVLIAGAAGADTRMLSFYREVLKNHDTWAAFDIGNIHCISNDQQTHDFNVNVYKNMLLTEFNLSKPIWVTEAEAMYSSVAEENFLSTKTSTANAIAAGAERIFFTRDDFGDTRTDMSKINPKSNYPSAEKFREIIKAYEK